MLKWACPRCYTINAEGAEFCSHDFYRPLERIEFEVCYDCKENPATNEFQRAYLCESCTSKRLIKEMEEAEMTSIKELADRLTKEIEAKAKAEADLSEAEAKAIGALVETLEDEGFIDEPDHDDPDDSEDEDGLDSDEDLWDEEGDDEDDSSSDFEDEEEE